MTSDDSFPEADEFNIGDRVRCIDPKDMLKADEIYTIAHIIEGKLHLAEFPSFGWYPCRFARILDEAERMHELLSEVVDEESTDRAGNPWMRCSPDLPIHIKALRVDYQKAIETAKYWQVCTQKLQGALTVIRALVGLPPQNESGHHADLGDMIRGLTAERNELRRQAGVESSQ